MITILHMKSGLHKAPHGVALDNKFWKEIINSHAGMFSQATGYFNVDELTLWY